MGKNKLGPVRHINRCPIHGNYPAASAMLPCPLCAKEGRDHAASTVKGPPARRQTGGTPLLPGSRRLHFPSFQAIAEIVRRGPGESEPEVDLGPPGKVHVLGRPRLFRDGVYFPRIDLMQDPDIRAGIERGLQYLKEGKVTPWTVPCAHCGKPVRLRAHYCGTPCRQKAYRRRKKSDPD